MRKSELDQAGPCVNLRVSAGLQVKLTLSIVTQYCLLYW